MKAFCFGIVKQAALLLAFVLMMGCLFGCQEKAEPVIQTTASQETEQPETESTEPSQPDATEPPTMEGSGSVEETYEYDEDGNIVQSSQYEDGLLMVEREYEAGVEIARHVYTYNAQQEHYCTDTYDGAGKHIQRQAFRDGGLLFSWEYHYDENGQLTEKISLNENGEETDGMYAMTGELYTVLSTKDGIFSLTETYYVEGQPYESSVYDGRWNRLEYASYEAGKEISRRVWTYDAADNVSGSIRYENGEETEKSTYLYDDNGLLLEQTCEKNGQKERVVYTYDDGGWQAMEMHYVDDVPQYAYAYNEYGELISSSEYENGKLFWRGSYVYEEAELLASATSEFFLDDEKLWKKFTMDGGMVCDGMVQGGQIISCLVCTYNDDGTWVEQETNYSDSEVECHYFYAYDAMGNLVGIYTPRSGVDYAAGYDDQGRILWDYQNAFPESSDTSYEYAADGSYIGYFVGATYGSSELKYNSQGQLMQAIHYGDGNVEYQVEYRYDDHGNVIEEIESYDGDGEATVYTYTYEYDADGNWILKVCSMDGEETERIARQYDAAGNLISEDDGWQVSTHSYDENGLRVRTDRETPDGPQGMTLYTYDDAGVLIEEISYLN